jgi:hypothetical protein
MVVNIEERETYKKTDMVAATNCNDAFFRPKDIVECVWIKVDSNTAIQAIDFLPDHDGRLELWCGTIPKIDDSESSS